MRYHIPFLDKKETKAYVEHRLNICGVRESIFSDPAIEAIYQNTTGIPRVIDSIAGKALTLAAMRKKHMITEEEIFSASKEI
jgi:type II secretory pathway predicted ATPase ExeA